MPVLNFVKQGSGPAIVLSHALGCDLRMWDEVAAQLVAGYTVLRYDHRGHGKSPIVRDAFSIGDMADDAAAMIESELEGDVHFVGLSMGGMVAQQLAVRHPHLVTSVVVANSSSYYDEAARRIWQARIETVRREGVQAVAEAAMQRWFTPAFRQDPQGSRRVAALRAVLESCDAQAYAAACEAISRIDFRAMNPGITCPVLVIAGTKDEGTPLEMSEAICKSIPGARLAAIEAAHLSAVEQPVQFAQLVSGFIRGLGKNR